MNSGDQLELLTVTELKTLLKEEPTIQLIDVRTAEEYAEGHLEGAVNIDYKSDDFAVQLAKVDMDQTTVLYCARGSRSHQAYLLAKDLEFNRLYDLIGGYNAWMAEDDAGQ